MLPKVVKDRWLSCLAWQSILSPILYSVYKFLTFNRFIEHPILPPLFELLSFIVFNISLLFFAFSLFMASSPRRDRLAPISQFVQRFIRAILGYMATGSVTLLDLDFRCRVHKSVNCIIFLVLCVLSGFLSALAIFGTLEGFNYLRLIRLGRRGTIFGMVYGLHFLSKRRWVLAFPIVQRPLYFSFKLGLYRCFCLAIKLASISYLLASMLMVFGPDNLKHKRTLTQLTNQELVLYLGTVVIAFCWELSAHLLQVVHTQRWAFAASQGFIVADANPTGPLLLALEHSIPMSLHQYLAYLDLCMVSESSVNAWRRAAFFEETGEIYKRVVSVCLRPLEELTSRLAEGVGNKASGSAVSSLKEPSTSDAHRKTKLNEAFDDFQLYVWCARSVSALTSRSHAEDRFGVAQLTGCNALAMSTLLSCLCAVEACLGKKSIPQASRLTDPGVIKWGSSSAWVRSDRLTAERKMSLDVHSKAYAMYDALKVSVYSIISVFQDEMRAISRTGSLSKEWISKREMPYGSSDILVQKLSLFLAYEV